MLIFLYCFLAALGSLLHRADRDFEVGEYVIPKDATVVAVIRGLMYDAKVSTGTDEMTSHSSTSILYSTQSLHFQ